MSSRLSDERYATGEVAGAEEFELKPLVGISFTFVEICINPTLYAESTDTDQSRPSAARGSKSNVHSSHLYI